MRVKLLTSTAKPPTRGSAEAVGYDFYSDTLVLPANVYDDFPDELHISK